VIEIKNLLFQPLTFHLAGGGQGLHLNHFLITFAAYSSSEYSKGYNAAICSLTRASNWLLSPRWLLTSIDGMP